MRDFLRGWRTLILNLTVGLTTLVSVLVPILHLPEVLALIPPSWMPVVTLFVTLANTVLRLDTRTPPPAVIGRVMSVLNVFRRA